MTEPLPPPEAAITTEIPVVVPDRVPEGLLEPVLARRESMRRGMDALERAMATPAGADEWAEGAHRAVGRLRRAWDAHVQGAEGSEGLTSIMIDAAPRLIGRAQRLAREHPDLEQRMQALEAAVAGERVDPDQVRDLGTELIAKLVRHRQKGSDLFYEAFQADVEGGE
jgi:hypothetical protein